MKHYFIKAMILPIISVVIVPISLNASDITQSTIQKNPLYRHKNNSPLSLQTAIQDAIQFSPQIKSTESAIDALNGTVKQARYQHNPEIGFNIDNVAGHGLYQGIDTSEYNIFASTLIERGDKHNAKIYAAMATVDTTKINILTGKLDIKYSVEMVYLDILAAYEQLRLARSQEETAQKTLNFIAKRVAMAADHETQRTKANFLYTQAVSNRKLAEQQLTQAKQKLAIICGYQNTHFDIVYHDFLNISSPTIITDYDAVPDIPDLQKYDFIKKEKQALLMLEKANAISDPKISAGIRHFAASSDQAFMLGVSIPIAIYDKNQGNIARAYAEIDQAEHDRKQAELATKQILFDAHQELSNTYTQLRDIEKKLLPQAQRSFSLSKTAYMNDILSYIEVLDAQNTLFDMKQKYINLVKQYHIAQIKLNRLTHTL
jgi:cobalt-zinc-cadmium efflux system outer membrane protein